MATVQELEQALVKADAAGNTEDAKILADAVRQARAAQAQVSQSESAATQAPQAPAAVPQQSFWDRMRGNPSDNIDLSSMASAGPGRLDPTQDDRGKAVYGAVADMGAEAAGASGGQALGAMTGPAAPAAIPVFGAIGAAGGNALGQARRMWTGEQQGFKPGQVVGAAITGAIPGGSLVKAGAKTLVKEGAKAATTNLVAATAQTVIDQGRLPTTGEVALASGLGAIAPTIVSKLDKGLNPMAQKYLKKEVLDGPRREVLAAMAEAGYVVPPSVVNKRGAGIVGKINNTLESIGGKAATAQQAQIINQEVTNGLARKALGLPENMPITDSVIAAVRAEAKKPYDEIATMAETAQKNLEALKKPSFMVSDPHERNILMSDPETVKKASSLGVQAGADLMAWGKARDAAKDGFSAYKATGDKTALESARKAKAMADDLHEKIVKATEEMGRPDLAAALRESQVKYAKIAEIDAALNRATGDIDAGTLGKSYDSGTPMTGEIKTIARTQNTFAKYLTDATKTPTPGVNKLSTYLLAGAGGALGGKLSGGAGATMGTLAGLALPAMLEQPTRNAMLSQQYQRLMTQPYYGYNMPDMQAQLAKYATMKAGR